MYSPLESEQTANDNIKKFNSKATDNNNGTVDDGKVVNEINLHHQEGTGPPRQLQQGKAWLA